MQALLMRASSLRLMSDNHARYLWQQISAKGWRLREPADVDFPYEAPVVLQSIVASHLSDLGYTFDDLMKMLRIHGGEFTEMYGDFSPPSQGPRLRIIH